MQTFPSDPERKTEWVKAIRRDKFWIPSKHHKICSKHFEPQYYLENSKLRKLTKDAIPTLDLPGSISSNVAAVTHCINCMYTTEVKTEKVEDVGSPANSWTGDEDISVNSKNNEKTVTLTTIAIDPLSPKIGSSRSDPELKTKRHKKSTDVTLKKKLLKKEETCKGHVQKIYSLLKANRRLCQQNKNLRRTLMNMKKKIAVSGKRNGNHSDDEDADDDDDEESSESDS